jgi:hypothetical protein
VKREQPHVAVKKAKTMALLRTVFGERKLTVEESMELGRLLYEKVSDETMELELDLLELELPVSPTNALTGPEILESSASPMDDLDEPGGFVTEDLKMLGLYGSGAEVGKSEVVETPPVRRSVRLLEKRKASEQAERDSKRRRDSIEDNGGDGDEEMYDVKK